MGVRSQSRGEALPAACALLAALALACGKSHGPDGDEHDPFARVRGALYVSRDRLPYVVELDEDLSARSIALATGPTPAAEVAYVLAQWSPDGTRLAYLVWSRDERSWLAVAQAPEWEHPIAAWPLPDDARSERLSWLGGDELIVDLGGGHLQRHVLAEPAPQDLGWFDDHVTAADTLLAREHEATRHRVLRPGTEPITIEVDVKATAMLSADGTDAALLSLGEPPRASSDALQLNAIGWTMPGPLAQESCIQEQSSCPLIIEQPRTSVDRVEWTADGRAIVVELELDAGLLDVDHELRSIPHASGYSLNVAPVGQPLQLGSQQT